MSDEATNGATLQERIDRLRREIEDREQEIYALQVDLDDLDLEIDRKEKAHQRLMKELDDLEDLQEKGFV